MGKAEAIYLLCMAALFSVVAALVNDTSLWVAFKQVGAGLAAFAGGALSVVAYRAIRQRAKPPA